MTDATELARREAEKKYRDQLYPNERIAAFLSGYKFSEQALLAAETKLLHATRVAEANSIALTEEMAKGEARIQRAERAEAALKEALDIVEDYDACLEGRHQECVALRQEAADSKARAALMHGYLIFDKTVAGSILNRTPTCPFPTGGEREALELIKSRALPDPSPPSEKPA